MLTLGAFGHCRMSMHTYTHTHTHTCARSLLTRMLLPFGMCLIMLMMMETTEYTEYEITLKVKPVFLLLLYYVSIVFSSLDCLWATTL